MIDSIGFSEAWDILYWAVILAITLILIQRYDESTRGWRFWILIPILVLLVGFSIHVFSIGTAIGTGLEHPLLVIAYIYTNHDNDYYDNYNRVIQEPDSLKVIELR